MQTSITKDRLAWGVADIATATGLSQCFIRNEIRAKRLRARKIGGRVLILDADLKSYLNADENESEGMQDAA